MEQIDQTWGLNKEFYIKNEQTINKANRRDLFVDLLCENITCLSLVNGLIQKTDTKKFKLEYKMPPPPKRKEKGKRKTFQSDSDLE